MWFCAVTANHYAPGHLGCCWEHSFSKITAVPEQSTMGTCGLLAQNSQACCDVRGAERLQPRPQVWKKIEGKDWAWGNAGCLKPHLAEKQCFLEH